MATAVKSIKGVHDILPAHAHSWHSFEQHVREVMVDYGYQEMRTPILEKTELFKRSIGEVTDIVEKEMYAFEDRNGDMLSLRPENTASCVRAAIQHGMLDNNQVSRIWYLGPMFRRENPQRGRYRQFWQVGAEVYGVAGPHIEAELILLSANLWRRLGLSENVVLEINSLGSNEDRAAYRVALVDWLRAHDSELDDDSRRRLETNPLRVLDSKNPQIIELIKNAPLLSDYLCDDSRQHFESLQETLRRCDVPFVINPKLVRGLDYYSHTVFEWVTQKLGAQGTVCAGGRYDGLTEQLGAKLTPGVGWALGVERLIELIAEVAGPVEAPAADIFLVLAGAQATIEGLALAEEIRQAKGGLQVVSNCAGGGMKSQFKRADRSGAAVALIMGEDELAKGMVGIKPLRGQAEQQTVPRSDAISAVLALFG